jgi:hypothetical protein
VGRFGVVVAVIGGIAGVVAVGDAYRSFAKLEGRVSTLEDRVRTLTVNPLAEACAGFAGELANLTPGDMFDENHMKALRSAMEAMGCSAPKK